MLWNRTATKMPQEWLLEGMTARSLDVLMEINPTVANCLRDGQEEARFERWTSVGYARQVWEQSERKRKQSQVHRA